MKRQPPEADNDRPLTFGTAALWTVCALFLDLLFLGMTEAGREGAFYDLVSRTACGALAYAIVFFGILRLHEPETSIRHVLAWRMPSVWAMLLALLAGAALSMPSEWFDQLLDVRFPRPPADKEALDRILGIGTLGKRVTLVLTLVVLQPMLDELFFRGVIFTPLRRTRTAEMVIVASAGLETLGSLSPRAMISLLGATLVFAWIRGVTGSIIPSILARMAYYGVVIVPMTLGGDTPKPTVPILVGSGLVFVASLSVLSLLERNKARRAALASGE